MARRDEFDDEGIFDRLLKRKDNVELPLGLRRIFIGGGILLLLIGLVTVLFSALSGSGGSDGQAVPLIRADNAPLRVKPEEPGGMAVPNKDSTIFNTLKGDREEGGVENLLDDGGDTASVAREEVASKVEKKTEPLVDVELEAEAPKADEKSVASVIDTLKEENKPQVAAPAVEVVKEEPPKMELPKAAMPKADPIKTEQVKIDTPKPASSGGATYIQLAAVKSEAEANTQWSKFKAKNPELASLSLKVQKADLGAKGIFYRIQAGPLTADAATSTCAAVKSRGGNCIIVK